MVTLSICLINQLAADAQQTYKAIPKYSAAFLAQAREREREKAHKSVTNSSNYHEALADIF